MDVSPDVFNVSGIRVTFTDLNAAAASDVTRSLLDVAVSSVLRGIATSRATEAYVVCNCGPLLFI